MQALTSPPTATSTMLPPLVLAGLGSQSLLVVLSPTIVPVATDLQVSTGAVGQARTVTAAVALAASLWLLGRVDGLGVARLLRSAAVLAVAGCAATSTAPGLAWFLGAHVVVGLGFAGLTSAAFAGVAAFPSDQRPRAMAYVAASHGVAWVVANPLVALATDAASWRAAQLVPAAAAVLVLVTTRPLPAVTSPASRPSLPMLGADRSARTWVAAETLAYSGWAAVLTFVGALFADRLGVSVAVVGWLLAAGAAAYVVTSTASRALGPARPALVAGTTVAMALAVVVLMAAESVLVAAVGFVAVATAAGVRTPVSGSLGMQQLSHHPGTMMSARTAAVQVGYLAGAASGGALVTASGYPALGVLLAAFLVGSALLILRVGVEEATNLERNDEHHVRGRYGGRGARRSVAARSMSWVSGRRARRGDAAPCRAGVRRVAGRTWHEGSLRPGASARCRRRSRGRAGR